MALIYQSLENGNVSDVKRGITGTFTAGVSTGFKKTGMGLGLNFDGADSTLVTNWTSNAEFQNGFSIEAWVYVRSSGETGRIVDKTAGTGGADGFTYYIGAGNRNFLILINGGGSVVSATDSLVYNKWIHIVTTFTVGALVTHYVNGVVSGTPAVSNALSTITSANPLTIGNNAGGTARTFDGLIQNVKIWNTVLTQAEIDKEYAEFQRAKQTGALTRTVSGFEYPDPTDLSSEKNRTFGSDELTGWDFTSASWLDYTGGSDVDADTFQSGGAGAGGVRYLSILNKATRYQVQVAGTKTGATFSIRSAGGTVYKDITDNTFDTTFEFNPVEAGGLLLYLTAASQQCTITKLIAYPIGGLIAGWNMKAVNGAVTDISGNGNNGTVTGALDTKGVFGRALDFDGVDDTVPTTLTSNLGFQNGFTLSAWINPRSSGETLGRIFDKSSGTTGNSGFRYGIGNSNNAIFMSINDGAFPYSATNSVPYNKWTHVITTVASNATVTHYINGVVSGTPTATGVLSGITTTNPLTIGNRSTATDFTWDGIIDEPRIWSRVLTQAEITAQYQKGAKQVKLLEDFSDEGADGVTKLPAGWQLVSGTWKIGQATADSSVIKKGDKYLENVTAGILAIQSESAYGTFEFDLYKGDGTTQPTVSIISSANSVATGYAVQFNASEAIRLLRSASTIDFATANAYIAITTWYRIRVTRTNLGVFSVYIKGGAFTNWTLVDVTGGSGSNPATDNVITTSKYFAIDLDATDRIANLLIYQGIV